MTETLQAALTPRTRPPVPGGLSASLTFGWRALLKIKHVPQQLFDVRAFPIMFTLLFTFLFGGALEGSTRAYAQFAIPGILVQTVAFITMYTGIALNTDISKGVFDRFRSLPIWRTSVLAGALIVCPNTLKSTWAREIDRYSTLPYAVFGAGKSARRVAFGSFRAAFYVINYEAVVREVKRHAVGTLQPDPKNLDPIAALLPQAQAIPA